MSLYSKGPFTLCNLPLRFVFAYNGLYRRWWGCRSRIVWTLPLRLVQPICCDKRNCTVWTGLKQNYATTLNMNCVLRKYFLFLLYFFFVFCSLSSTFSNQRAIIRTWNGRKWTGYCTWRLGFEEWCLGSRYCLIRIHENRTGITGWSCPVCLPVSVIIPTEIYR